MASASSLAQFQPGAERGLETIEIDPQFASGLGFAQGDIVSPFIAPYNDIDTTLRSKSVSCMT